MECYPSKEEITDSVDENSRWMPYLLSTFLSYVVPDTVKRASMCQCIIKSSRPRTALPPLLFGIGIECDHVFGFKWLVNELYRLGFSISYSEVNRFKKSVVVNHSGENSIKNVYLQVFTQFVADNVDHNIINVYPQVFTQFVADNVDHNIINVYPQVFTQFVADNVDRNIRTLDG